MCSYSLDREQIPEHVTKWCIDGYLSFVARVSLNIAIMLIKVLILKSNFACMYYMDCH